MTRLDEQPLPPHSIDAEQAVLGALMLKPDALAIISDWLHESDFYRQDHQLIFRAISHLANGSKPVDAVTMGEWFEENKLTDLVGGSSYILRLANNTPSAANINAYAEIVREKSSQRHMLDMAHEVIGSVTKSGATSSDVAAMASQKISSITARAARGGLIPARQAMKKLYAQVLDRYNNKSPLVGLPTPWRDVNALTKGLRKKTLYIIAGRPSMGKSILGLEIAVFAALRGHHSAMFSVEMSEEECMARACAAHGNIPFDWLDNPDDRPGADELWPKYSTITQDIIASPLLIDETPGISCDAVVARARRAHQRRPLELLVSDHLHDFDIPDPNKEQFELGRIVQAHKSLAKELDIPVVLLAQLNRGNEDRPDKRPVLRDLRMSGAIEQKADVVFFIHREDYYNRDAEPTNCAELIPAKGRNLRVDGSIYLKDEREFMRFTDWEGAPPERRESPQKKAAGRAIRGKGRDDENDSHKGAL